MEKTPENLINPKFRCKAGAYQEEKTPEKLINPNFRCKARVISGEEYTEKTDKSEFPVQCPKYNVKETVIKKQFQRTIRIVRNLLYKKEL